MPRKESVRGRRRRGFVFNRRARFGAGQSSARGYSVGDGRLAPQLDPRPSRQGRQGSPGFVRPQSGSGDSEISSLAPIEGRLPVRGAGQERFALSAREFLGCANLRGQGTARDHSHWNSAEWSRPGKAHLDAGAAGIRSHHFPTSRLPSRRGTPVHTRGNPKCLEANGVASGPQARTPACATSRVCARTCCKAAPICACCRTCSVIRT